VTSDIRPYRDIVWFAVTPENLAGDDALGLAVCPAVCANLKPLEETGRVLPRAPR
jgi:hypothetical protein